VNFEESSSKEDKKIYVLQDSTFSIQRYRKLKMVKAFILDTAFKTTTKSSGCLSNRINHRVSYNKANINIDMQFHYSGTFVDTSSILS
jgi:hypothetical protein